MMRAKVAALGLILVSLAGCTGESPAPPPPLPAEAPAAKAGAPTLTPVRVSPTGDWVADTLDGLTLTDRTGRNTRPYQGEDKVAFTSWAPSGARLLVITRGGKVLLVTPGEGAAWDLSAKVTGLGGGPGYNVEWSPDGSEVLLSVGLHLAPLWRINSATGEAARLQDVNKLETMHWLTGGRVLLRLGAGCCEAQHMTLDLVTRTITPGGTAASVAVSPDGQRIAQTRYSGGDVLVTDRRGTNLTVPRPPAEIEGRYSYSALSWSPGSRFLAVALNQEGPPPQLRVHDFARVGGKEQVISNWAGQHAWLGQNELLYTTKEGGVLKVFLGKTELSRHLDATQLGLLGHAPIATRSPSGHKVAYAVAYPDHTAELVTADLATGAYTTTTRNGTGTAPLTWNPEGDRLVVAVATHTTESLPQGGTLSGWHPHKLTVLVTRDSFLPSTNGQWSAPTPAHHELLAHIPVPRGTQVIALEGKIGGQWFHLPFASVVATP